MNAHVHAPTRAHPHAHAAAHAHARTRTQVQNTIVAPVAAAPVFDSTTYSSTMLLSHARHDATSSANPPAVVAVPEW